MTNKIDCDAIVVGAGFAGLALIHHLKKTGISVKVLDKASEIGGTWAWNRYPGAATDSEGYYYCLTFSKEILQEWTWSERYPGWEETNRYLNFVADKCDMWPHIQLNTEVISAEFNKEDGLWIVKTNNGEELVCKYFISAMGMISQPVIPSFDGIEDFKGPCFHSSRWPQEGLDYDGRLGMKHFRYTVDDYFNADSSIRPTGSASPVNVDGIYGQWVMAENSDPDKRILYLHGGGYAIGTIRGYLSLTSQIAEKTGCSILLIDYSLAPEFKFPHGVNDSKKAFLWMLNNGPNGSGKCTKSYISGDSAGGGLSLGVTLALKDDNSDLPNAVIPLSPWAELDPVSETYDTNANIDPYISKDAIAAFRDLYIEDESDLINPYASPVYGNYEGFPPLLIQVGGREVLLNDSKKVAESAESSGCDVKLEVWDDMVHVFHGYAPFLPEANEALDAIADFISDK